MQLSVNNQIKNFCQSDRCSRTRAREMRSVLFGFLLLSPAVLGANILGVFSIASVSHQIVYRRLMLELNKRGHNITIITPNPVNDPSLKNYQEIDTSFIYEAHNRDLVANPKTLRLALILPEFLYLTFTPLSMTMCHAYLSHPKIQALMKENPKFDLLITEFGLNPCFYGFAKFSEYKHMGMFSFQTNFIVHANLGNPSDASYIPDVNFPYLGKLNFFQRLRLTAYQAFIWCYYVYLMESQTHLARLYFGQDLPHLVEIERNLSAMMVNTHFTMAFPRPNLPNMIEIGGPAFHLTGKNPKPLPKDIKAFVDEAPDGVVYFSLGTNVKTHNISMEEEKILIETFGRLKQKVLWKWDNEKLEVNLKNVMKAKWFPQVDVLAHPNVKAFVTQAGLQSVGEAIEYEVPMIVMPFFADQNHNARKMEREGVAIYLDFDTLNVETFLKALNDIIYDKKYKENMKRFSALVRDQPIPPLEKAVWWTEYVIRHNGAPHLRSVAATMPWYQYFMLDVLAFIGLVLFLFFYVTYIILRSIFRKLFKTQKPKED